MSTTIVRLLLVLAAATTAVACDDDNGTPPTGPTVTEVGVAVAAPPPSSAFPSPAGPAAPGFPPAPNHPPAPIFPVFGDVNVLTGVCPVIRLTVGGRVVITDRSTVFLIACRAIRTKTLIRASGRLTPTGTLIATLVEPTSR